MPHDNQIKVPVLRFTSAERRRESLRRNDFIACMFQEALARPEQGRVIRNRKNSFWPQPRRYVPFTIQLRTVAAQKLFPPRHDLAGAGLDIQSLRGDVNVYHIVKISNPSGISRRRESGRHVRGMVRFQR
jgi:hypothetical protein